MNKDHDDPKANVEPSEVARRAIRRSGRISRVWMVTAMVFWTLLGLVTIAGVYTFFALVWPPLKTVSQVGPEATDHEWSLLYHSLETTVRLIVPLVYVWAGSMVCAAVATLGYARASQSAALAQIRDELAAISRQLGQIHGGQP